MSQPAALVVTLIPNAKSFKWMAGMDLPWPHRALLMWTPLDDGDMEMGIDPRLRRAIWQALNSPERNIAMPEVTGVSRGPLQWISGLQGNAQFKMRWANDFEAFMTLFDESLFFVTSYDLDAQRPSTEQLAFWHDQGDVPEQLFTSGQRVVVRSGVDGFCLGIFCNNADEFEAFRQALASAVEAEGGSFKIGSEPTGR